MTLPRLEIDLAKIQHNARTLIRRLDHRGIAVTGVTKAFLGDAEMAHALVGAGIDTLADARIENIEAMQRAHVPAEFWLVRSPMLSQVDRVVAAADISFNSEADIIAALSAAARRADRCHGIVLMVELGDLREGIMPCDLESLAARVLELPNLSLKGIGTNLGCRSGVTPDDHNMTELSTLAESIEAKFSVSLSIVSGGNSSNLSWGFNAANVRRINDLRLGEAILLGNDPINGKSLAGLYTDAIVLIAEVIEAKTKPSVPWGNLGQKPFANLTTAVDSGDVLQAILAVGQQDVDPAGLSPKLAGIEIVAASSDHLIVNVGNAKIAVGSKLAFEPTYSALLRAMTSPFVAKVMVPIGMHATSHSQVDDAVELLAS